MSDETTITFGHGDTVFRVFLEPTCPFSAKAYAKLDALLEAAGPKNLTIAIQIQSQPWHTFSSVVSRCVLAATLTEKGANGACAVLDHVFQNREDFVLQDHSHGRNMDLSPRMIVSMIEALTQLPLKEPFEAKETTDLMKAHARFSRALGVHGSPTFMVNDTIREDLSSGDDIAKWLSALKLK